MASTISRSPGETFEFGRTFADTVRAGDVLALTGELGAGKTQFVKGLATGLGADRDAVTSPTFTLIHEYTDCRVPLFHFDLYRIESGDELIQLGLDDYLDSKGVLAIEWADKFPELMPKYTRWLDFRHANNGAREISERG